MIGSSVFGLPKGQFLRPFSDWKRTGDYPAFNLRNGPAFAAAATSGSFRREGDSFHYRGYFQATVGNSLTCEIYLPIGMTIDQAKFPKTGGVGFSTNTLINNVGYYVFSETSGTPSTTVTGILHVDFGNYPKHDTITFSKNSQDGHLNSDNSMTTSGWGVYVDFIVPIVGWSQER